MLRETAEVIAYANGIAQVKCQAQSACGQCAAQRRCGTAALAELNGKRHGQIFTVAAPTPLKAGQRVEIGLQEKSMLLSALLLYLAPLAALLTATFLSAAVSDHELIRTAIIIAATAFTLLGVKTYSRRFSTQTAFQPILLRVLSA